MNSIVSFVSSVLLKLVAHRDHSQINGSCQQRITFKVENVSNEKKMAKARVIAAKGPGVRAVKQRGDRIQVKGKGIDASKLCYALKKVGPSRITRLVEGDED